MGTTIDIKAAASAYSFPAIVIECNRFFISEDEFFIQCIKHLEERAV
jgi:hypothetical protein